MTKHEKKMLLLSLGAGVGAFIGATIAIKKSPRVRQFVDETADELKLKGRELRSQAGQYVSHGRQVLREAVNAGKQAYHESMQEAEIPHDGEARRPRPATGT